MTADQKNIEANKVTTEAALRQIREQQIRIDGLTATVGNLVERLNALEPVVLGLRAMLSGHGPTVK